MPRTCDAYVYILAQSSVHATFWCVDWLGHSPAYRSIAGLRARRIMEPASPGAGHGGDDLGRGLREERTMPDPKDGVEAPTLPVCRTCGGADVMRDAWAVWSLPGQTWTLGSVFDAAFCTICGGATELEMLT